MPIVAMGAIDDALARYCYIFTAVNVSVGLVALARNRIQPPVTQVVLAPSAWAHWVCSGGEGNRTLVVNDQSDSLADRETGIHS